MFLKHVPTGDLIDVVNLDELFDPTQAQVQGRDQAGQEEQEVATYPKEQLAFPSGEPLPQSWKSANYRSERRCC